MVVLRPPGADVKLIDDEIVEPRGLPAFGAPRIAFGNANDAVAVRKGGRRGQLARVRIPLPSGAADTLNEKHVRVAVAYSSQKAAPASVT